MFRRSRKPEPTIEPSRDIPDELRSTARRLIGWKWTGTGGLDLPTLLRDAAAEIDRTRAPMSDERDAMSEETWDAVLLRAEREPIGVDLSDFSDDVVRGFLAGQCSVLEEVAAGRLTLPAVLLGE